MPVPSVEFSQEVWDKTPEKAKELGCSPDFNAWTGSFNPPPKNVEKPRLRCAGGHIHIGWTNDEDITDKNHILNCRDLVKQLDWYLGGWSLRQDSDAARRSLYGSAGACRFKPYGVEYRTLSNFWLTSSTKREAVWNRMQRAIHDMRTNFMPEYVERYSKSSGFDFNKSLVQSIDNNCPDHYLERQFRFPLVEVSSPKKQSIAEYFATMSNEAVAPAPPQGGMGTMQPSPTTFIINN